MRWSWGVAGIVCWVGMAHAQTLQAGLAGGGGYFSLGSAFEMSVLEEAQSFQSENDFTATSATIWTTFQNGPDPLPIANNGFQGMFEWAIYSDAGTQPGGALYSGSVVPTLLQQQISGPGFDVSQWSFDLPDVALEGDTRYWMGLRDTDGSGTYTQSNFYWLASFGAPPGIPASQSRRNSGDAWSQNPEVDVDYTGYGNHLSLGVYGYPTASTTPEPGVLTLLGMGLMGLAPVVRRRQRHYNKP